MSPKIPTAKEFVAYGIIGMNLYTYFQYAYFGLAFERAMVDFGGYAVLALVLIAVAQK